MDLVRRRARRTVRRRAAAAIAAAERAWARTGRPESHDRPAGWRNYGGERISHCGADAAAGGAPQAGVAAPVPHAARASVHRRLPAVGLHALSLALDEP